MINPTNTLIQFLTLIAGLISYTIITVTGNDGSIVLAFIGGQLTAKAVDVGLIAAKNGNGKKNGEGT